MSSADAARPAAITKYVPRQPTKDSARTMLSDAAAAPRLPAACTVVVASTRRVPDRSMPKTSEYAGVRKTPKPPESTSVPAASCTTP